MTSELLPEELLWADGGHASDVVLTALADGEDAIVPEVARRHVGNCVHCTHALGRVALLSVHASEELEQSREAMDEVLFRRARHVVTEMQRTRLAVAALRCHDYATLGAQLDASHRSTAIDYEVSCEELDVITDAARANDGVFGARLTGAGFGGCAIALLRPGCSTAVAAGVAATFAARFGAKPAFDLLRVGNGPGEVA